MQQRRKEVAFLKGLPRARYCAPHPGLSHTTSIYTFSVCQTLPAALYTSSDLILTSIPQGPYKVCVSTGPMLEMRKLKFREVN